MSPLSQTSCLHKPAVPFVHGSVASTVCAVHSQHHTPAETPSLFTCQVVLFYAEGSIARWGEKEPIIRDSTEITKLVCHILTGVLHGRVCRDTLFLRPEQSWAAFAYLSLSQCLFWGIQQLKCGIKLLLSVPCCILLHHAALCLSRSLLELSLWSIKPGSMIATVLSLHKVIAVSGAR